jgi:hypothetical protein
VFAALLFSTGGAAIKGVHPHRVAGRELPVGHCRRDTAAARAGDATRLGLAAGTRWRCLAATLILFVTANKLTTSANTIFLRATSPVYLLLLGRCS